MGAPRGLPRGGARPIPSTRGLYLAGADGHVYRRCPGGYARLAERADGSRRNVAARGIRHMCVNVSVGGRQASRRVHRLVAEAWLDGWNPLLEVHHLNGDTLDNRPCNLALLTRAEHERAHGAKWVTDVDVENCRLDIELRSPSPPEAPPRAPRRRRDPRASGARRVAALAAEASALAEELERRGLEW